MKYQSVRQATITLPHFEYEMPVLYPDGGDAYVPVRAVCDMLGIRADTRIQRWRYLLLWEHARKLPWRAPGQQARIVWCLHLGALPFLYSCFDWSYVRPDRRTQLRQAMDESLDVLDRAYREKQIRYRKLHRLLFLFLTKLAGAEQTLQEKTQHLFPLLATTSWTDLDNLVQRGCQLIQEITTAAKNMLHEQGKSLIVDGIQLDSEGHITDTSSMPLFPVDPREEDIDAFSRSGRMLLLWQDAFATFLREQGLLPVSLI
jgi:hypothetical protein